MRLPRTTSSPTVAAARTRAYRTADDGHGREDRRGKAGVASAHPPLRAQPRRTGRSRISTRRAVARCCRAPCTGEPSPARCVPRSLQRPTPQAARRARRERPRAQRTPTGHFLIRRRTRRTRRRTHRTGPRRRVGVTAGRPSTSAGAHRGHRAHEGLGSATTSETRPCVIANRLRPAPGCAHRASRRYGPCGSRRSSARPVSAVRLPWSADRRPSRAAPRARAA